jgi:short-subunit dehydrogenase
MTRELCIITGVGPATGADLARQFGQRYRVAMIARNNERLEALCSEIEGSSRYVCDLSDAQAFTETLAAIVAEHGEPAVVIHNAVGGSFGDVLSIKPETLARNFQINTMALLQLIQTFGPGMVAREQGVILATGNTSAYRGRPNFASFAPTKAAQRILLESAARQLWPSGVHVCFVAVDAAINTPAMRKMLPDQPEEFFCKSADIARECFHLAHQPRSAWTFDVMIRPRGETW